jgi:hypothetical protein
MSINQTAINLFISSLQKQKKFIVIALLFLFVFESMGQVIHVGGLLEESTSWTSDFIYEIDEDLIVPTGVTLTIDPGTSVRVDYNRGIIVNNGVLRILGVEGDSVLMFPNHSSSTEEWQWKGIILKNTNSGNIIHFARIIDAEIAIRIMGSRNVKVENSSLLKSQNYGVIIENSSWCSVSNCLINNYNGIELLAGYLESTSNNTISNCIIRNRNQNIKVQGDSDGVTSNNIISGNLIEGGNNGIWFSNKGNAAFSGNIIKENFIINKGLEAGYGLFLAHDSTVVSDNVFWKNHIALFSDENGHDCLITNNSFYQNNSAVFVGTGSIGNKYLHNTFSLNFGRVLTVREANNIGFGNNNMLHNNGIDIIAINNTETDLSVINNYWGTTDTSVINRIIYDKKDSPGLGELKFKPYLSSIDTSNPVSPPVKVIKQIDGDKLRLSWSPNNEADLAGYRVYYGKFKNYSFENSFELGMDTSFVLSEIISLGDSVAVTAFDINGTSVNAQKRGHESPFEFAAFYPFAGRDTIICNDEKSYEILDANIPFEYEDVLWVTDGDGYFNNSHVKFPTYYPGYLDNFYGTVKLSMEVNTSENVYLDEFNLTILKNPIAFAGNDTIIFPDMQLSIENAIAYNYDSINWRSSGDGIFNSDTILNPVYSPGIEDIENGAAYLIFTAYSFCEPAIDTVKIIIEPYYSVEGHLWTSQKYQHSAAILAFKEDDEMKAVKIVSCQTDGYFVFEKLITGKYYFYAVPDTNNQENVVPAYYANKVNWQSSYLLNVDSDVFDVDIHLPSVDNILPKGDASISGHMLIPESSDYNSDIYCSPWISCSENMFCSEGMSNVTIFLFNHDGSKLLDYTLTNNLGDFYFHNLPFGTYVVTAEIAGVESVPSSPINLTQENNAETDVVLEISNQKLAFTIKNEKTIENTLMVFPNPTTDKISIQFSNPPGSSIKIDIFDLFGNRVLSRFIDANEVSSVCNLNIRGISSGLYFGQISNSGQIMRFRFVKD